jgi:hypothetical protein
MLTDTWRTLAMRMRLRRAFCERTAVSGIKSKPSGVTTAGDTKLQRIKQSKSNTSNPKGMISKEKTLIVCDSVIV